MKYSKLMQERIRRVKILFRELGYRVFDSERMEESYSAGFENEEGFQAGVFIDSGSRFLEVAYTFSFSPSMAEFVRSRLEEMLKISYEYGCYINLQTTAEEIAFSVFTKIYYSGLNYYSMRESLRDFKQCVYSLTDTMEIASNQ